MDLDVVKRTGIAAAYKAAEILRAKFGKITRVRKKGAIDLVTEADAESEKAIIETVRRVFPEHSILAEESGLNTGKADCCWIIDPLDGTTNYAHRFGLFAISIAFEQNTKIQAGIVLCPLTDELFVATRGNGASLNGRPIRVSDSAVVAESLLVTGFPYDLQNIFAPTMARFANCLTASQGVRRLGSAALDLCYVACGRFDAFWEQNLKSWDTAAGALIAAESGAVVTDFSNRPFSADKNEILATNGIIHDEMIALLKLEDITCEKS